MKQFEVMFIIIPVAEAQEEAVKKYEKLINDNRGKVYRTSQWGKKRLAYEVKDLSEGYYILMEFDAPSSCAEELDKQMKLDDDVLRHMIVRKGF